MRLVVSLVIVCILIVTSSVLAADSPDDAEPPRTFGV
jgi:hypothetical protein